MAQRSDDILKGYFNTGDFPTESQFADLIDSKQSTLAASTGIDIQDDASGYKVISSTLIRTFSNQSTLESVLQKFVDDSVSGIAIYKSQSGSTRTNNYNFTNTTGTVGSIIVIGITSTTFDNSTLTFTKLGLGKRTQIITPYQTGESYWSSGAILLRGFRFWEVISYFGKVTNNTTEK